jgi:hypothetical protein
MMIFHYDRQVMGAMAEGKVRKGVAWEIFVEKEPSFHVPLTK